MNDQDKIVNLMRKHGLKATPQRVEVYKALKELGHADPEAIFERVKGHLPGLSLATVYNALNAMASKGIVSRLVLKDNSQFFDITLEPHAHFLCYKCGGIWDVHTKVSPFSPEVTEVARVILRQNIVYYGVCRKCGTQSKQKQSKQRR